MNHIIGFQADYQERLFYSFNLEDHVPQNHLLRGIDRHLDLSDLRQHLGDFYSHTGRPSVAPELMIRMLIIGYSLGIRSERRLCEEVHLNSVLQRCMAEGLVRGEGFATDASIIKADAQRMNSVPGEEAMNWKNSVETARPVREYLDALEEANGTAFTPKFVSLSDPSATWTGATGGPAFFAYSTNYLIDLKAGIIVDVEASAVNKTAEVEATKTMIERVEDKYDMKPDRLVGDTNYGSAAMLGWLVDEKQIEPHVPVCDKSERKDGTFSVSDFQWDEQANEYRCPEDHALRNDWRPFKNLRNRITKDNTIIYTSSQYECAACSKKDRCCPNTPKRKIARSIHEHARDVARRIYMTPEYQRSPSERKKVEMLFAHRKRILKLDKLRLRGPSGAQDEFLLAVTAQNLRRMAKWLTPVAQEAVMPRLPLMISFNRDQVQPSFWANATWVMLAGSRNSSRRISPGWKGFLG